MTKFKSNTAKYYLGIIFIIVPLISISLLVKNNESDLNAQSEYLINSIRHFYPNQYEGPSSSMLAKREQYLHTRSIAELHVLINEVRQDNLDPHNSYWLHRELRHYCKNHFLDCDSLFEYKFELKIERPKSTSNQIKYVDGLFHEIRVLYEQNEDELYVALNDYLLWYLYNSDLKKTSKKFYVTSMISCALNYLSSTSPELDEKIKFCLKESSEFDKQINLKSYIRLQYINWAMEEKLEFDDIQKHIAENESNESWLDLTYAKLILSQMVESEDLSLSKKLLDAGLKQVPEECEIMGQIIQAQMVDIALSEKDYNLAISLGGEIEKVKCKDPEAQIFRILNKPSIANAHLELSKLHQDNTHSLQALKYYTEYSEFFENSKDFAEDPHYTDVLHESQQKKVETLKLLFDRKIAKIETLWQEAKKLKNLRSTINEGQKLKNKNTEEIENLLKEFRSHSVSISKENLWRKKDSNLMNSQFSLLIKILSLQNKNQYNNESIKSPKTSNTALPFIEDSSTIHIEFVDLESSFLIFAIDANGTKLSSIPKDSTITNKVLTLKNSFANNRPLKNNTDDLYKSFFSTLDLHNYESLSISTDGILNGFPFDNLRSSKTMGIPLVDLLDISYNSNISNINKEHNTYTHSAAFFGFSDSVTISSKKEKEVPELNSSLIEKSIFTDKLDAKSQVKSGYEATKANLQNLFEADLLHISSHAHSNSSNRFDNFIVTRELNSIDRLYGFELSSLDIRSKLVIFSACETGTGFFEKGEGVHSFSKYLIENNVESVVSTLWRVNDKASAKFYEFFYFEYHSGKSVSASLANAKRRIKNIPKYSHPYYWAGYILEGNPNICISPN